MRTSRARFISASVKNTRATTKRIATPDLVTDVAGRPSLYVWSGRAFEVAYFYAQIASIQNDLTRLATEPVPEGAARSRTERIRCVLTELNDALALGDVSSRAAPASLAEGSEILDPGLIARRRSSLPRRRLSAGSGGALSHVLFRPRSNLSWPWFHVVSFELQRAWSRVPEEAVA